MANETQNVLVIGGTGAQGMAVVKALSEDPQYKVEVLTRSAESTSARELALLPNVSIREGDVYDEATLSKAFRSANLVWVNTNGFAIGERNEIFFGIRMFEIARASGVSHFQWASLPYVSKLGSFDPKYRTGHMDAKGKVADYLRAQPTSPMKWSILTSCMYMETLTEMLSPRPSPEEPGTMVFSAPVGNGQVPLIHLDDLGRYAHWIFDHPERSNGLDLQVATESVSWEYLARIFTEVTGQKSVYKDVTLAEYFESGVFPFPEAKIGHGVQGDTTLMSYRDNFSGFWNSWKDNLVRVDYDLLDEILPTRVKTLDQWMRLVEYTGQQASVLKDYRDRARS